MYQIDLQVSWSEIGIGSLLTWKHHVRVTFLCTLEKSKDENCWNMWIRECLLTLSFYCFKMCSLIFVKLLSNESDLWNQTWINSTNRAKSCNSNSKMPNNTKQQECIPVGCVPPAAIAIFPTTHAPHHARPPHNTYPPATHAPCHACPPTTHTPLPHMPPRHACPPAMHVPPATHTLHVFGKNNR